MDKRFIRHTNHNLDITGASDKTCDDCQFRKFTSGAKHNNCNVFGKDISVKRCKQCTSKEIKRIYS